MAEEENKQEEVSGSLFDWADSEEMSFTAFEEKVNKEPEKEKENQEEEEGEDVFAAFSTPKSEEKIEEGQEEEKKVSEDANATETLDTISLVQSMKENGLLDYELEEDEKLTPELAKEILDNDREDKVLNQVEDLLKELPEDVKNLNKFILNGGNLKDYIKNINVDTSLSRDMDLEDPSNQSLIVRNKLEEEGFDEEYITDQIAYLTEKGKLKSTANVHFKKWSEEEAKKEEALIQQQAQQKENMKLEKKARRKKVQDFVTENEEVGGFKFSEEDKKDLPLYMTEESVVLEDGRKMTPFQRDVLATLADEKKAMLLAKLAKNNFDFSSLKESAVTEKTREAKEKLRRTKTSTPSSSTRSGSQTKSLADYF